jgi:hypothetical protein
MEVTHRLRIERGEGPRIERADGAYPVRSTQLRVLAFAAHRENDTARM